MDFALSEALATLKKMVEVLRPSKLRHLWTSGMKDTIGHMKRP